MTVNTDEPIGYKDITVKYREHGEYQYFASFAVSFGYRGIHTTTAEDTGITLARLWADGELIYDISTGNVATGVKWYIRKGTEDQDPIPGWNLAYRGHLLICFVDYPLGDNASIPTISAEFIDTVSYSVAGILQSFAILAGYDEEDITTEGLSALPVLGYILDGQATLEGVATELGFLYDFAMSETAGIVAFARKYDEFGVLTPDLVVPDGYLAQLQEGSSDGRISITERSADQSLPAKISAQYFDVDANYDTGNQTVQRNGGPIKTHSSSTDIAVTVPIVAEGAEIRSLLYDALTRAWQERNGHALRLPPMFLALNPGDVIGWSNWGAEYTGMLVKTTINADNSMSASLIEKEANYSASILATQSPATPVAHVGHETVRTVLFDAPDTDDDQTIPDYINIRVAIGGLEPGAFHGARLDFARLEPLPTWVTAVNLTASQEIMIATLVSIDGSTIDITLGNMTEAKLTAGIGDNLVIGSGSTSEIVTYTGWTNLGGGDYRLTGVTRGLFGSELFVTKHVAGEAAAFMDDMPVYAISADDYRAGQRFLYRTVADGMADWEADALVFIPSGNSRKPYSPNNVDADRDIGGDWTLTWETDDRFGGEPDSVFSIDIYNEDWTAIVRRINALDTALSGNIYTYYIEEQMIDGVNELDTVNFLVYQVNASHVGRGFPGGGNFSEETDDVLLEGDIDVYPEFTGELSIGHLLEGIIDVDPEVSGDLSVESDPVLLEGTIDVDPEITGTLSITHELEGIIDVDPELTGELSIPTTRVVFKSVGPEVLGDLRSTLNLVAPATVDADDMLIAFVMRRNGISSSPSGWYRAAHARGGSSAQDLDIWVKRQAAGTEGGATFSWSQGGSNLCAGIIMSVEATAGGVVDIIKGAISALEHGTGTDLPVLPFTAIEDGQLVVVGASPVETTGFSSVTSPAGMTSVTGTAAAIDRRVFVAYQERDNGETASGNFTLSSSVTNRNVLKASVLLGQRTDTVEDVDYKGAGAYNVQNGVTSINLQTPADVENGDLMLAFVVARSTLTPPSGWSLISSEAVTGGGVTQTLYVYQKDTVTTSDENVSTTWGQSASNRFLGQILNWRCLSGATPVVRDIVANSGSHATGWAEFVINPVTAYADGQAAFQASSNITQTATASLSSTPETNMSYTDAGSRADRRLVIIETHDMTAGRTVAHEAVQSTGVGNQDGWTYISGLITGPST